MSKLPYRIGFGYDIHRFAPDRKLVLGGVEIPCDQGLEGHSDADCLTHALADAILGACGLPDIGHQYPNTDPAIEGIDSQIILAKAAQLAYDAGYSIGNIDSCIIAEKPKVSPFIDAMKAVLSKTLKIPAGCIGIKATTQERIGALGAGEGIAAHAVCLLNKI
ncbi:MAG: 2-C-methyl-D-erythritol 2,4-cyclodiphosphate synthase [Verrucomicrobia bacterium]|nr:2-C-methyl-D-erythritol 2,4-cyclodiphosphate synthase [Verrucomicrobiota bacterium]MDA1068834.1 2-C-methyl-D-erythritol 2,4-cyclodiphosphate synthase [Verrucomicrobiota bacterium]